MDGIISLSIKYDVPDEYYFNNKKRATLEIRQHILKGLNDAILKYDLIKITEEQDLYHNTRVFTGTINIADTKKLHLLQKAPPLPRDFIKAEETARGLGYNRGFKDGVLACIDALVECLDTDRNVEAFINEFREALGQKEKIDILEEIKTP